MSGSSKASRLPVGTIAGLAALYAVAYFVWEQSHWGTASMRNLIGNLAFMPFNLGVLILFGLASRGPVLDPGVRRALRFLALGGGMVFTGNAISAWYVLALNANPPVSTLDITSSSRPAPVISRPTKCSPARRSEP